MGIVSTAVIVIVPNSVGYFVGFGVLGGLAGVGATTSYFMVTEWFQHHRAKALMLIGSASSIGLAVITPLFVINESWLSWRVAYKLSIGIGLVFVIDFTGIKNLDLSKAYVNSVYVGKSLDKHDVYYANFESEKWAIVATYDIDRDLLIGAVFLDHADENKVKVTDRNIGVIFEGTLAEAMTLKNGSAEDVAKIKAKQKNPYVEEKNEKGGSVSEKLTSMLTVEEASAGGFCGYDSNGNPLYSSEVCGWVSVAYCAAAGLLGFWPGLICAATTMWGCTYQCN